MSTKERILFILCIIFFASLFSPVFIALKTISMAALAAFSIAFPFIRPVSPVRIHKPFIFFTAAFAGWLLLSTTWSDNAGDSSRFIVLRLPLIILPFTLGLVSTSLAFRNRLLLALAWIVLVAVSFSAASATMYALRENNPDRFYNDYLSMAINQQSIYTSALVNISIYIFTWALWRSKTTTGRILYISAILLLLVLGFLLASRNMMVLLYGSIFLAAIYLVISRKKYIAGLAVLGTLAGLLVIIFSFFPKTLNRFNELRFTSYSFNSEAGEAHYSGNLSSEQWNGANFRLAAWSCGWELAKRAPVAGVGIGDKRDALYSVYQERDFKFGLRAKKNVHNNYLDILLSLGVIGLVLFTVGWLLIPAMVFIRRKDYLALWITITLAFAMITEVYFDRSLGGLIFGFFIPLLLIGRGPRDTQAS